MELFKELQNQMHTYRFRPDRRIGQNFIIDGSVIEKMIIAAELKENDIVLEVGPGTGFLTEKLLKHCKVIAVELDDALAELLRDWLKETCSYPRQHFGSETSKIHEGCFPSPISYFIAADEFSHSSLFQAWCFCAAEGIRAKNTFRARLQRL